MVTGINHITLSVSELDRSFAFYAEVLGFAPLARWSRGAYLLGGELWLCLHVDARTRKAAPTEYTHLAFSVADFEAARQRLVATGAPVWQDNATEGASVYILDPDGHKLEIHRGDWRTRLASMRANPWEDGIQFFA